MNGVAVQKEPLTFSDLLAVLFAASGLAGGVILVLKSPETEMQLQGAILAASGIIFFLVAGMSGNNSRTYNSNMVKAAIIAAVFWCIAGILVDQYLAWDATIGRLRPLHTSAIIFACGGNALLASSFYVGQRTCGTKLYGRFAPWFVVIGFNTMVVMATTGYILGITEGKEYAEPEWYTDLWLTLVWMVYLAVFLGTVLRSKEGRIHVANWCYLFVIAAVAILHIANNATIPVSFTSSKSYAVYAGVQDAMTQWWYSHRWFRLWR
jgi:cytochrome c oxidase cbb3-type subunit I